MQMIDRTTRCLPGSFVRRLSPRQGVIPRAPSVEAGSKTACIIGPDNGMGLSRDRKILAAALRGAGWRVSYAAYRDRSGARHAVNFHLETISAQFVRLAERNVVIPNPEWWQTAYTGSLADSSVVIWAKTADAERVFRGLGAKVEQLGFCSLDRRDLDMQLRYGRKRTFLHIAGASPNKGTKRLVSAWQKDWPWLCVVSSKPLGLAEFASNVSVVYRRLPDEALQRLQNECLFHIYPSEYEGFGHAQWEGLSCGAIVLATGAAPFEEHPEAFRLLDAVPAGLGDRAGVGIARRHKVTDKALAEAIDWARSLADEQIAKLSAASRQAWETKEAAFKRRLHELIAGLEQSPRIEVVTSQLPAFGYVGRVNCVTGQGSAARHQLHVLRKHGLRFRVIDGGSCASPDPAASDPFIQAARRSDPGSEATAGTIIHLQPNTAESFHRGDLPRPHVLVSVWETTKLPAAWVPLINSYDQVWCATKWQRDVYLASGVREDLLRVVPFALDPDLYSAQPKQNTGRTIFGSVFQWSERKDPATLIGAYAQAFSAADPVLLLLKSYEGDNPTTSTAKRVEAIVKQIRPGGDHPQIGVISSALDSAAMTTFYDSIDCYVSAHRGEGFGLPIAEALLHGRPVIATGWSAPAEYAAGLIRPVNHALQAPHGMEWQPFYTPDQRWAQADRDDLAAAMRVAAAGSISCDSAAVRGRFAGLCEQAGEAAKAALRELFR